MEEEIDLRPYIEALIKNWKWIVGVGVVTAVIAFIIASLRPPTYAATALVTIIDTREIVKLDDGISDVIGNQPLAAFPELALSDEVLRIVLEEVSLENDLTIRELRANLEAESGADKTVIRLTSTTNKAEESAHLTNAWAEAFVNWANRLYQGKGGERLVFFEEQLKSAETSLTAAEDALEAYQGINRTAIISNALNNSRQNHAVYLKQQERTQQLHDNAQALRQQILNISTGDPISYADQLTYLQLQLQTFNDEDTSPVILDLSAQETLTTSNRDEQIEILDGLIETLAGKKIQLDKKVTEIEPHILTLQSEIQESSTRLARLEHNVAVAQETYNSLVFQVEEEQIVSQDTTGGFQLASKAAVSEKALSDSRLGITMLAGLVGLFIAVFVFVFVLWWNTLFKKS
ncbi:MAG: hypothetical protein DWQ04_14280 [Chloroflexi bacterium]|nr:MAG: hypothetical protein DWQ04_14280 [Chloroflexota bacterium]